MCDETHELVFSFLHTNLAATRVSLNYIGVPGSSDFKPNKALEDILKVLHFRWFQMNNSSDGRRSQVMNCKRGESIPEDFVEKRTELLNRLSRCVEKPPESEDED